MKTGSLVTICPGPASNEVMSFVVKNPGTASAQQLEARPGVQIPFTLHPLPGEGMEALCRRLTAALREQEATPLHLLVFGQRRGRAAVHEAFQRHLGLTDWPVTWVEGGACDGSAVAGIQVYAFTGGVERLEVNGRVVGSVFTDGGARQCVLGGLTPTDPTRSRAAQTCRVLDDLQTLLASAGFELADLVRTWFYLDEILGWYDDFNQARTGVYTGVKFHTGSLPASTGVGAKNPAGTALALAAWAFRPLEKHARAREIASPLQCPAPAYGSSFSRAMDIASAKGRRLFISGTASIAHGGKTLWTGDIRQQVKQTMEVVGAILQAQSYSFADLTHATAYFRHAADAGVFTQWLVANQLRDLPVISTQCDVCRDNLLFELEAGAQKPENAGSPGRE